MKIVEESHTLEEREPDQFVWYAKAKSECYCGTGQQLKEEQDTTGLESNKSKWL